MAPCVEEQPEAWTRAYLMCRDERPHGYVVGFRAAALDTLGQTVETRAVFGSEAAQGHDASEERDQR